jgi:hypothetical protein
MSLESNPERYNAPTRDQIPTDIGGNGGGSLPPIIAPPQSPQSPAPHDPAAQKSKWWDKCWEHRQFILEFVAFVVLCAYTGFACLQWLQIKWTNTLTREALDGNDKALQATLTKMQGQINEMHTLAINAGTQATQTTRLAGNTHDLAVATRHQAYASKNIASSAIKQADIATKSENLLEAQTLPYLIMQRVDFDGPIGLPGSICTS